MKEWDLKKRTKRFALDILQLVGDLPSTNVGRALGHQVIRSATSGGANYRAADRARSVPEFISKMGIVEEESDETGYWLELVIDGAVLPLSRVAPLLAEANELTAIVVASSKTAKRRHPKQLPRRRPSDE